MKSKWNEWVNFNQIFKCILYRYTRTLVVKQMSVQLILECRPKSLVMCYTICVHQLKSIQNEPSDNMNKNPDWILDVQSDDDGVHSRQENLPENKERKFIVFESQLDLLLCRECIYCGLNKIARKTVVGTGLVVYLTCNCYNIERWYSQPMSGTMPLGNIILAGAIMFAGSSPTTMLNVFKFCSIQCFSDRTYSSIQNGYLVSVINSVLGTHDRGIWLQRSRILGNHWN